MVERTYNPNKAEIPLEEKIRLNSLSLIRLGDLKEKIEEKKKARLKRIAELLEELEEQNVDSK